MSDLIRNYNKTPSIVSDTVIAGGVGACVALASNYGMQRIMLKHPQFWTDHFEKAILELNTKGDKQPKIDIYQKRIELINKGKKDWKLINKRTLKTAGIVAGVYFLYRCIKALLIRPE